MTGPKKNIISSGGGSRCSVVVMKCLFDRNKWKPKIHFYQCGDFGKRDLDDKQREVMKVKTKKSRERKELQQHCGKRKDTAGGKEKLDSSKC